MLQICRAAAEAGAAASGWWAAPFGTRCSTGRSRSSISKLSASGRTISTGCWRIWACGWTGSGRAFSVLKLRGIPVDIALPRREVSFGAGHRDFLVDADPDMSVEDAAARRDYTINAISYEPLAGRVDDPLGGPR